MSDVRRKMEARFETMARMFYRHRLKTLVVMFLLIAGIVSQIPRITLDTSTEGFLHETDPTLIDYNAFRDQFGRDEMIIVAIKPPEVFDFPFLKKLGSLHNDLRDKVPHVEDITSLINARSTRGQENELIVEDLLENLPETPEALAAVKVRALENPMYRNMLLSEDGKFTTIIIKTQRYTSLGKDSDVLEGFNEPGKAEGGIAKKKYLTDSENSEVIRAVRSVVAGYESSDFKTYIAGSPVVTHFMKQSMMKDMRKFMMLAVIAISIFLFLMFRRISGVVLPLLIVILSLLSTVGVMAALGVSIKVPTQILPSFLLAVCVGDSVHILSIFYQQLRNGQKKEDAVVYAIGHSGLAVFMTSATTAGGLLSFATADIAPVADLGIFASIGVMIALVYTLVLLPSMLSLIPVKTAAVKKESRTGHRMDRLMAAIGRISTGHPQAIVILSAVIVAVSLVGAAKIRFSHDILGWFPKTSDVRTATEEIDRELRGSIALEVILDTGKENGLYDPSILNRLEKSAKTVESLELGEIFAGKAFSLTIILKEINRALNENRGEFYAIPQDRKLVAQEFLLFENSGSDDLEDFTDSQFRKARFTVKAPFKDAVAYSRFIDVVNTHFKKDYPEASITVTGMMALLFRTIHNVIVTMAQSYVIAFLVITILMVLLIGKLRIGLLSMIPNIAPIILMLGVMGWFGIPMDLFTMMVGSIAIGLVVDDTIHFMHNFRRYFERSNDAVGAVMETLHTTGQALLVTSLVLSVGFFIFMFASMNNLFYFGMLTGLTIISALLADYFLSPALMVLAYRTNTVGSHARRFQPEKVAAILLLMASVTMILPGMVSADDPKAREIAQTAQDRNDGDHMTAEMEMVLIDRNEQQRIRKLRTFSKDKGKDTWKILFFMHPADVKDTGFLSYDYDAPERDDDQWLYLPALRKTKRIANADKSGSFMGSDFTYSDMTSRNLEDYDLTLLKEVDVNGHKTWMIQALPRSPKVIEETGYEKSLAFIRQDNYVKVRAVHWVRDGGYLKYMDVKTLEQIEGIWVATEIHMTTKKDKETVHKTILKLSDIKYNQNLDDEVFTARRLEKGL